VGEVHVIFQVIADTDGEPLAWIKTAPASESAPRVVMAPVNPAHVFHEDVEINDVIHDRAHLATALRNAIADRRRRR
jgi:hypothetical protein